MVKSNCLFYSMKDDEAILLFLTVTSSRFTSYLVEHKELPTNAELGMWFQVNYEVLSQTHVTVSNVLSIDAIIPTRRVLGPYTQVLLNVKAKGDQLVCLYGDVLAIKDSIADKIRSSQKGEPMWCIWHPFKHLFTAVQLHEPDSLSEQMSALPVASMTATPYNGIVKNISDKFITFIILRPEEDHYSFKVDAEGFPEKLNPKTSLGKWYKLWLSDVDGTKQYVHSEAISPIREIRIRNGSLEIAANIRIQPSSKLYYCEFGKLLKPLEPLRTIIETQQDDMYWCKLCGNGRMYAMELVKTNAASNCINTIDKQNKAIRTKSPINEVFVKPFSKLPSLRKPNSFYGLVCAEHQNVFFIYSSDFTYEVISVSVENTESTLIVVGDWVEFDVKDASDDFLPKHKRAVSLRIMDRAPLNAIACYDSVLVETDIDVPSNYLSSHNPIHCTFAVSVCDDRRLIDKNLCGTTLLVVLFYAYKEDDPCGHWRIERIRRILRRY